MRSGRVKWFNETKGYGFITPQDGGEDVFVHYTSIKAEGFRTLKEGQEVTFHLEKGVRGPQAVDVMLGD